MLRRATSVAERIAPPADGSERDPLDAERTLAMSAIDRAFIRAYEPDDESPRVGVCGASRAMTRSAAASAHASSAQRSAPAGPHFRVIARAGAGVAPPWASGDRCRRLRQQRRRWKDGFARRSRWTAFAGRLSPNR